MSTINPSPTANLLPPTFRARGVAVPVTTPLLAGTRVRLSASTGVEFVVPNPFGGRGNYIVHLAGLSAICRPTMHDMLLLQQLAKLTNVTPETVRSLALNVALEGHAGQAAAAAAAETVSRDRAQRQQMHRSLLSALIEQLEPDNRLSPDSPDLNRRAQAVLGRIAPSLGISVPRVSKGVLELGEAIGPIGFPQNDSDARIPRLIQRLATTRADMDRWISADPANDVGGLGSVLLSAFEMAREAGALVLRHTHTRLAHPVELLKRWVTDAPEAFRLLERCSWVLDGWDQACLVWLTAQTDATRRVALLELPLLVPILPREAIEWNDVAIPSAATEQACRVTIHEDRWRKGGAAFALIERNEKLRARSL